MSRKTYIGVDFGGTKLLIGEVDQGGNILNQKRYTTELVEQNQAAKRIEECLEDYYATVGFLGEPVSIGIGMVGIVDARKGIWRSMNHKDRNDIPLAETLYQKYHLPVYLDNDVKSAAHAELVWGIGRHCSDFIYINIGTGLAAGIVMDGRVIRGVSNNAGEIGHCIVRQDRKEECECGQKGCIEHYTSGLGLHKEVLRLAKEHNTSLTIPEEGRIWAADIFEAADKGDELCQMVTEQAAEDLANLIMNLVRVLDPEAIVLGGGVAGSGWMTEKIEKNLIPSVMRDVKDGLTLSKIDAAKVGLLGAASLGWEGENNK